MYKKLFVLLKQPLNIVLLYIFLISVVDTEIIPLRGVVGDIVLVSILILALVPYLIQRTEKNIMSLAKKTLEWPNVLIAAYLFWALISLNYSLDKQVSFFYVVGGTIVFLVGFVLVKDLFDSAWYRKLLYIILVAGILPAVYAGVLLIIQIINPNIISTFAIVDVNFSDKFAIHNIPILISYFRHPNTLGIMAFYSFAASTSLLVIEQRKSISKWITVFAILFLFMLVLSFSRASILAGVVFTFLISFSALKRKVYSIPIFLVILASALSVFLINNVGLRIPFGNPRPFSQNPSIQEDLVEESEDAFDELAEEADLYVPKKVSKRGTSSRTVIWNSSLGYIEEKPITGAGFGNSPEAIADGIPDNLSRFRGVTPHNTYLRTAVESGIVGFILYLSILLSAGLLVIKQWKLIRPEGWVLIGLTSAVIVYQMFETNFLLGTGFRSFYFLVLLASLFTYLSNLKPRKRKAT